MTRSLRWIRRLLLAILALLVLLLALLAFLAGSETGTRWVFDLVQRFVPALQVGSVEGALTGPLDLESLSFRPQQGGGVELDSLQLQWSPKKLLSAELSIQRLALDGLLILPGETAEPEPQSDTAYSGFNMPRQILLPLSVDIEELTLNDLRIEGGTEPLLNSLQLSASMKQSDLKLRLFKLDAPMARADLAGQMALTGDYELDFTSDLVLRLPERPEITLKGTLQGALDAIVLKQEASGPLSARLDAQLDGVTTSDPNWQAQLGLESLDLIALAPEAEASGLSDISAKLKASGSFTGADLSFQGAFNQAQTGPMELSFAASGDLEHAEIKQLSLVQSAGDARIDLSGHIAPLTPEGELALDLNWSDLAYPLTGEAQFTSPKGALTLSGTLDNYLAELDIGVQAPPLEAINLTGEARGNLQRIDSLDLIAQAPEGKAQIKGSAGWQPMPVWNLNVEADQLDPGYFVADWPGKISALIHTEGQIDAEPTLTARIEKLGGTLRQQPLSGRGQVNLAGGVWQLQDFDLSWSEADVSASGEVGEAIALDFDLSLPALDKLMPEAGGQLSASGKVSGTPAMPALNATLAAEALRWQNYQVGTVNGRVNFDPQWRSPADIALQASGLNMAGQLIDSVDLRISGTDQALNTRLDVQAGEQSLDASLDGSLSLTATEWGYDGRLSELALTQSDIGRWRLAEPAPLRLGPNAYRLEQLCLVAESQQGRLCAQGGLEEGSMLGQFSLDRLPLALVQPYLPPGAEIQGYVDGDGRFESQDEQMNYTLRIELPKAGIRSTDRDLGLTLDTTALTVEGDQQLAQVRLDAPLPELKGALNASIDIDNPTTDPGLDGQVSLELPELSALNVLSSDLVIQSGHARADLRLGGKASAPSVRGVVSLEEGDMEIPAVGLHLTAVSVNLRDADTLDKLLLDGSVTSGEGSLALQGEIWPLESRINATLKGENFQAVDTREMAVRISTDMTLAVDPERVAVGGTLVVPEALIRPPKASPNAASRSSDLVVIEEGVDGEQTLGPALDLDLSVELGDNVRVDAFGFNGLLKGALRVQQEGQGVPRGTGRVGVQSGEYTLYGQVLTISRGDVLFSGGPVTNPGLDLRVDREVDDVTVGAVISGTLRTPDLALTSSPSMPDNHILSYLVLGRAPGSASSGEQQMLMRMALALAGGKKVAGRIQETLHVDELGFGSGESAEDTSFYIGKYLTPDLYIKYGVGLGDTVNTFLVRYRLAARWLLESTTSSEASGGDLIYSFER